jgi:hypothetical protein
MVALYSRGMGPVVIQPMIGEVALNIVLSVNTLEYGPVARPRPRNKLLCNCRCLVAASNSEYFPSSVSPNCSRYRLPACHNNSSQLNCKSPITTPQELSNGPLWDKYVRIVKETPIPVTVHGLCLVTRVVAYFMVYFPLIFIYYIKWW